MNKQKLFFGYLVIIAGMVVTVSLSSNNYPHITHSQSNLYTLNIDSFNDIVDHADTTSGNPVYFNYQGLEEQNNIVGSLSTNGYIKNGSEIRGIQSINVNSDGNFTIYALDDYMDVIDTYHGVNNQNITFDNPTNYFKLTAEEDINLNSMDIIYSCSKAVFDTVNLEKASSVISNYEYDSDMFARYHVEEYQDETTSSKSSPRIKRTSSSNYDDIKDELDGFYVLTKEANAKGKSLAMRNFDTINNWIATELTYLLETFLANQSHLVLGEEYIFDEYGDSCVLEYENHNIIFTVNSMCDPLNFYCTNNDQIIYADDGSFSEKLVISKSGYDIYELSPGVTINDAYEGVLLPTDFDVKIHIPNNPREPLSFSCYYYDYLPHLDGSYLGSLTSIDYFISRQGTKVSSCKKQMKKTIGVNGNDIVYSSPNNELISLSNHFSYAYTYVENYNPNSTFFDGLQSLQIEYKNQPLLEFLPTQNILSLNSYSLNGWQEMYFDELGHVRADRILPSYAYASAYTKINDVYYSLNDMRQNMTDELGIEQCCDGHYTNKKIIVKSNFIFNIGEEGWNNYTYLQLFDALNKLYGITLKNDNGEIRYILNKTPLNLVSNAFVSHLMDPVIIEELIK